MDGWIGAGDRWCSEQLNDAHMNEGLRGGKIFSHI